MEYGNGNNIGDVEEDDNPSFVAPSIRDYRIQAQSPVIDKSDNTAIGAVAVAVAGDLDRYPRYLDDPQSPDDGVLDGHCGIADMGAYEYVPVTFNPQQPEPNPALRSRYVAFVPPTTTGVESALRLTLTDLSSFAERDGETRWVGAPYEAPDEDSSEPGKTFVVAPLQCEPYYRDWSSYDLIYVYGAEILPYSKYTVETTTCSSPSEGSGDFWAPTVVATGAWGDVESPFASQTAGAQPDFSDISAVVDKFLAKPTAPIKAFAQLQPNVVFPSRPIDFNDVAAAVQGYLGTPYSSWEYGPCTCPSTVTCGATACSDDSICDPGLCTNGYCTDACGRCAP